MINIICAWSRPEEGNPNTYTKEYVQRLYDGICKHAHDRDFVFWCMTPYADVKFKGAINKVIQENDSITTRGWWIKLHLFNLFGKSNCGHTGCHLCLLPNLYLDLDTVITGSINDIIDYVENIKMFTILRDFYRPDGYGSGMMAWHGDYSHISDHFFKDPEGIMKKYGGKLGDQWVIQDTVKQAAFWQTVLPRQVVSYKVHCKDGIPKDARVVCFHGVPKPRDVNWLEGGIQ